MKPAVIIRQAGTADVSLILSFIRKLADYEMLSHEATVTEQVLRQSLFGAQPRAYVLFAVVDGKEVGFALYFYNFSTFLGRSGLYIEDVFVDAEYRGKGIGKAIYKHLAQKAVAEGCGRMEWWVLNWNSPSIAFYDKIGAEPMNDWTVYRLTEEKLNKLAEKG